jgi:hypothetical protein
MKKLILYLIAPMILLMANCSGESSDWENAKTQNTVQVYKQFIKDHPQSIYKDSASIMMNELINPKGIVVSVPITLSMQEAVSGQIDNLNFSGNTVKVKLNNGEKVEAIATEEQMEEAFNGKNIATLEKITDNQWKVLKLEENTGKNKKSDSIK